MKAGELVIQLKRARGVKGYEFLRFGKADMYVVFSLGGEMRNSKVVHRGGSKPVWDEQVSFRIAEYVNFALYHTLKVHLFDKDSKIKEKEADRDSARGTITIDIETLLREHENDVPHMLYPVIYKGRERGVVELALTFVPSNRVPGAIKS